MGTTETAHALAGGPSGGINDPVVRALADVLLRPFRHKPLRYTSHTDLRTSILTMIVDDAMILANLHEFVNFLCYNRVKALKALIDLLPLNQVNSYDLY